MPNTPNVGHHQPSGTAKRDQRWWPSAELAELAAAQDGLLGIDQLRSSGVPEGTRKQWLQNRRLVWLAPGVYALGHSELSERGWRRAALMSIGPDSALAQVSALEHRDICRFLDRRVHVVVPRGSCGPRARFQVHRAVLLDERDVEVVDGLRCTTIARALVDLAGSASYATLAYACRQVEYKRQLDVRAIGICLSRMNRQPGTRRLRRVLAPAGIDGAIMETALEQRGFDMLLDAGLPRPQTQVRFDLRPAHPPIRVDLYFPQAALVVEIDGPHHTLPLQRERDRLRDLALNAIGVAVIRITDVELDTGPRGAAQRVADALFQRWSSRAFGNG